MLIRPLLLGLTVLGTLAGADDPRTRVAPDRFATLIDPDCSHCRDEAKRRAGELKDDDRVLAWIRGDYQGGAIPFRFFLVPYRVISDTYGVFVYDPDAGFSRGWPASTDFRFHGWRDGVMLMSRQADGTVFDCLTGIAVAGPGGEKGERLTAIPTLETNWGAWNAAYPGTVAYEMKPKFQAAALPDGVSEESRSTRPATVDTRLDPEARVFGLDLGTEQIAWPLAAIFPEGGKGHLSQSGSKYLVIADGASQAVAAYQPRTEGDDPRDLTLRLRTEGADGPGIVVDEQTGSRWDIAGRCVDGSLKGRSLKWLPGVKVKWFAWSHAYPGTKLVDPSH